VREVSFKRLGTLPPFVGTLSADLRVFGVVRFGGSAPPEGGRSSLRSEGAGAGKVPFPAPLVRVPIQQEGTREDWRLCPDRDTPAPDGGAAPSGFGPSRPDCGPACFGRCRSLKTLRRCGSANRRPACVGAVLTFDQSAAKRVRGEGFGLTWWTPEAPRESGRSGPDRGGFGAAFQPGFSAALMAAVGGGIEPRDSRREGAPGFPFTRRRRYRRGREFLEPDAAAHR